MEINGNFRLGSGHSLGTLGTDATVLTINGLVGGANELDVNGDADISGMLTVEDLTVTGTSDLQGEVLNTNRRALAQRRCQCHGQYCPYSR